MVAGETILPNEPAAQLTPASGSLPWVFVAWDHAKIIRAVYANGAAGGSPVRTEWGIATATLPHSPPR